MKALAVWTAFILAIVGLAYVNGAGIVLLASVALVMVKAAVLPVVVVTALLVATRSWWR